MTNPTNPDTPTPSELADRLRGLLAKATPGRLIADAHHTRDYAGRNHGFLRSAGELVPVAAVVLGVEGMAEDKGRARLELLAEGINALPDLLSLILSQEEIIKELRIELSKATGLQTVSLVDQDGKEVGYTMRSVAEMLIEEAHVDDNGTVWTRPTAWAYFAVCRARDVLEAKNKELRDKARSVMSRNGGGK